MAEITHDMANVDPTSQLFRIGTTDHTFYVTAQDHDEARMKAGEIFNVDGDGFEVTLMCEVPW